jgi:hypothetical protein
VQFAQNVDTPAALDAALAAAKAFNGPALIAAQWMRTACRPS